MAELSKFQIMLQAEHDKALQELVKNKAFRFYMSELLGYCKTFDNAFSEKGNVAAYNNGRQAVGQKIFNDITSINPEIYVQMCKEEAEYFKMKETFDKKESEDGKSGQTI